MRLFAGIELDDATRAHCVDVQDRLRRAAFDATYEPPDKLHITLAFLGNVAEERVAEIATVLDTVAAGTAAFELVLDRLSAFPNNRRPRILYIGSWKQGGSYSSLAAVVRRKYEALGFGFDEDAVAHVTIGRVKGGSLRPLPVLDITATHLAVRRITLFESIASRQGSQYEIRHAALLKL